MNGQIVADVVLHLGCEVWIAVDLVFLLSPVELIE